MRRMSGRSPPFVSIGLAFISLLLAYNCWILSSQNGDLAKQIEDLQTEIKLSGVKQDQYKKKVQLLQENANDMDTKASGLKHKLEEDESNMHDAQNIIKRKEFELISHKNDNAKLQESQKELLRQLEDKDSKIDILQQEAQHILALKNEADEVVSEKDTRINKLMRQIEQLTNEIALMQKEKAFPEPVAGLMNILNAEKKEPYLDKGLLPYVPRSAVHDHVKSLSGFISHPGMPMLPRQPSNVPRPKPRFSVSDIVQGKLLDFDQKESPIMSHSEAKLLASKQPVVLGGPPENAGIEKPYSKPELQQNKPLLSPDLNDIQEEKKDDNLIPVLNKPANIKSPDVPNAGIANPVIHEPDLLKKNEPDMHQNEMNNWQERAHVLPAPLQNPDENPDTAIDDEEKAIDDPSDDQDEEGKEIKKDLENNADANYNNGDYDPDERLVGFHVDKGHKLFRNLEPRGFGANIEIPRDDIDAGGEDGREDVNVDEERDQRAHDKVYDTNLGNRIRNLGRH